MRKMFGGNAERVMSLYPAGQTKDQVLDAAQALATDQGMAYNMWRLGESHLKSSGKPVYRFVFARPRPRFLGAANQTPGTAGGIITGAVAAPDSPKWRGAVHSAEIEYALGNLATNKHYAWEPGDYKLSALMEDYFANFIKTGDPNSSHAVPENRARYVLLDEILRRK